MKFPKRGLSAATLFVCLPSTQAGEVEATRLEPVVVTATRTERGVEETPASVTVIQREEIQRRQAQSIQDLLRGVPGISISNEGGLGKTTSVFMRGTNSDHVLVLIDGVRAGSATTGSMAFQDLPIDQIERIEIVRGPRSGLYGSEAIGGVIQFFTRKGSKGLKPYLTAGGGSYSTYKVTGGVSGGGEHGTYSLNGAQLETHGFNARQGNEPDSDGYRNTSGSANGTYRFDNGLEIEGNIWQAEGHNLYDGLFQNRSTFVQQTLSGRLKYAPTDFWSTSLRAGRTLDESDNYRQKNFSSAFNTQRVSTTWQNDFTLMEAQTLSLGLDYYNDQVSGNTDYAVTSRDDLAGFAQYQLNLEGWEALLGARYDDNEQFGSHSTGNVSLGYRFENGVRVWAGWGNAFKAPTFNQLYFPFYGNSHLKPEESDSWEASIGGRHLSVDWAINGYHTEVNHLINTVCDAAFNCTAENVDKARILGLEVQASTNIAGFDLASTLTLTDPLNKTPGPDYDSLLLRRPQAEFRFDLDRGIGPAKLGATVYGADRRYDFGDRRLTGFVTVDLRASVELYQGLSLEGRLANLLDEHYSFSYPYNQAGRNFFLNLRYHPDLL
jgi:vitamin B12 transporter